MRIRWEPEAKIACEASITGGIRDGELRPAEMNGAVLVSTSASRSPEQLRLTVKIFFIVNWFIENAAVGLFSRWPTSPRSPVPGFSRLAAARRPKS
jgi:hypothetical protein